MIDLHLHVLPGVDDGPATVGDAVALAEAAAAQGTTTVVATSHVSDRYPNRAEGLAAARAELEAALAERGIALDVVSGAELAIPQIAELGDDELRALSLGGNGTLLVEAPLSAAVSDPEPVLRNLQARGHRVVLAHPERSPVFLSDPGRLTAAVAEGALCSITASSLNGRFGSTVQRFAIRLLEEGLVHDVASDAHDLSGRRPEVLSELERAEEHVPGLAGLVPWLTEEAPQAILAGERVLPPPALPPRPEPPRRRWWQRRR